MITAFTCLPSYRHSSFNLRAYLCWRHIYCQWPVIELAMNVSPPLPTWSRFIRMRVFCGVKKRPTYCVAICRTNRKRSSFATNHFQRKLLKIFDLYPPPRSIVCGTNKHVKSEVLSNRHTHTDTQTKYCNPRCACEPRVNKALHTTHSN